MNREKVIKQNDRHVNERRLCPERRDVHAAPQQNYAAEQEHDELRGNGNGETEKRQNDDRNGELREHVDEIGTRKRLPEQSVAVAALSIKGFERLENSHDK